MSFVDFKLMSTCCDLKDKTHANANRRELTSAKELLLLQ